MPPKKIRVLVVDDAVVIRRIVSDVLAEDPDIEVVGAAANGRIALQKVTQLSPDILTLDVEMPEMNGLDTLKALHQTHPHIKVIMFSTLTDPGAIATIDALTFGAADYVTKPAHAGGTSQAQQHVREQLLPKIKALCQTPNSPMPRRTRAFDPPATAPRAGHALMPSAHHGAIDILTIGVSTGGPNALAAILPQLPPTLPVPIVLVQHMPPVFTRFLAERLDAQSSLEVREAIGGEELRPGFVYIAPGDHHMVVERKGASVVTVLNQNSPEHSCRPSVDVLFRSVAETYRSGVLAVVLTGMGQDGLLGCEEIKRWGGSVLVQDEATSVVWGMPGFVARAGLADRVLPLAEVAPELLRRIATGTSSWLDHARPATLAK
jgi:two-component system chemotaxis response regulator CheB